MDDRIRQNGAICDRCNETLTTYAMTRKSRCEFGCSPEEVLEAVDDVGYGNDLELIEAIMAHLAEHARFVPMGFEYVCAGCLTDAERPAFGLDGAA